MRFKHRTVLVILLSSIIISSALGLTIFTFYTYLEWKEKNIGKNYTLLTHDLNAQLFNKYIIIDLESKINKEGIFRDKPIVEGTIKNMSNVLWSSLLGLLTINLENRLIEEALRNLQN